MFVPILWTIPMGYNIIIIPMKISILLFFLTLYTRPMQLYIFQNIEFLLIH